ncbi:MAG: flagellar biosynthesis protein FlhB [Phenylobacterium sp.]|uniref:flagellar biosynthesis protein FlhB n=1 Tax=Phenylobacterium sp. TaxID=1871053 RepID=UPI003918CB40
MAEENDAASKTEDPTPRKLEQAREKGEVAKTPDLAPLAAMAAAAAVLALGGGYLLRNLAMALLPFIAHPEAIPLGGAGGLGVARMAMLAAAPILAAVLLTAAAAGAAGNLMQHGLMFTPSKLAPSLNKLSPLAGFKRLFGLDGLMQFVKSIVKILMVGAVAWLVMRPHWRELRELAALDPAAILPLSAAILRKLVFAVVALLLVIAGSDYLWQRYRFMERMRMSKEEVKEEFKQTDGDPHVKARLRQIRHERARRRMMQAVPGATVVVMNPTHYAVALKYDAQETPAPMCVAKGLDAVALRIRQIAEEAGVPVIEDPPLARALYAAVDIDDVIPPAHYEAVAKIIGFILSRRNSAAKPL